MPEKRTQMTLALYQEDERILLAMKKRGFGAGRWNGFGGKLKEGDSGLEDCVRRETNEEGKITITDLEKVGILDFIFEDKPGEVLEVHYFRILKYSGVPKETEEMRPEWFGLDSIPYDRMWPDDRYWMPLFLEGKKFQGKVLFKDKDTIKEKSIGVVSSLEN